MDQAYERDRIKTQIEQLQRESEQLTFTISREKSNEQFELEKVKREFKRKIETAESRQRDIQLELTSRRTELSRIEDRLREAATANHLSQIDKDRLRRRRS